VEEKRESRYNEYREVICNLYKKELVLDLKLMGQLQMAETCEDCIFGKMYMKLYEKEILELVYMDLWRLSPLVSARGAKYFMMLINSISTFRYIDFLKKKIAEVILKVLKKYMAEVEVNKVKTDKCMSG